MVLSVGVSVQPLPSPRTVHPVQERGAGAGADAALVMVEEVRSAGAALLCTQHTPAAPWVARVCLTAVPHPALVNYMSLHPWVLQRSYRPMGSQVVASHH